MVVKRKGGSLILVIIIGLFLSILGSAALFLSNSEAIRTTRQIEKMKAYYAARAGADAMADWMIGKTISQVKDYVDKNTDWQQLGDEDGLEFRIFINQNKSNSSVLNIISEGKYNNIKQKVVLTYEAVNEAQEYLFEMAAFSEQGVYIDGSSSITFSNTIKGTALITNSISDNSVELSGNPRINGDVYIGKDGNTQNVIKTPNTNYITGDKNVLKENKTYILPLFPVFDDSIPQRNPINLSGNKSSTVNQDGYYQEISIKGNNKLTIDTGTTGTIRKIRVRNLNIEQGHIDLIGNGKLELYIDDSLTLLGGSSINKSPNNNQLSTNNKKLTIYYGGASKPSLGGNIRIEGSIYIKTAELEIGGSNSITGSIISGGNKIEVKGAASTVQAVYAPNASVELSGSGELTGSVIAKHLKLTGNTHIRYFQIKTEDFPFEIPGAGSGYTLNYWYREVD
ncbi:hypothetical protein J2Z35_001158 [Acetoanaerobium pronyense]|uniref:DUF7305 domain-containing protein n=1 Tax=Acetoanaerobium pronyense TaxID=1482736 RepID=A0ABS4KL62_9FIRM|nr:hypothetical protein [Acetoanaerobium pronyense]MBP2027364.1 hypothetical protein [Acetoanaerobium pronyense]